MGEFVDSSLFIIIAFWSGMSIKELWVLLVSQYVFKVLHELIFSPILVFVIRKAKKI